jgi:hypothetical protein
MYIYLLDDEVIRSKRRRSNIYKGRAVAQAFSRWLPTAAARVRVRAACGVCGGQSGIGAGFLRVLRFSLPNIPPISILIITRGWHNRPIGGGSAEWTQLDSTPPPPPIYKLKRKKKTFTNVTT